MAALWLSLLVSAAAPTLLVLLVALCLHCRIRGPQTSIPQTNISDDYIRSSDFRIVHRPLHGEAPPPVLSSSNLLSPLSDPVDGSPDRPTSYSPSQNGSNPSYENPDAESSASDAEGTGYILVLPEGVEAPPTSSRASTPSSDVQHNYVNLADNPDYVNVEPASRFSPAMMSSRQRDDSSDDDDDDELGNYVNQ